MSKRAERKLRAAMRRAELAEELRQFMLKVARTTENGVKVGWGRVLTEAEAWLARRIQMFPTEAHMYRDAARMIDKDLSTLMKEWNGTRKGNSN